MNEVNEEHPLLINAALLIYDSTKPTNATSFELLSYPEQLNYIELVLLVWSRYEEIKNLPTTPSTAERVKNIIEKREHFSMVKEIDLLRRVALRIHCGSEGLETPGLLESLSEDKRAEYMAVAQLILQIFQDEGFVRMEEREKVATLSIVETAQLILKILQEEGLVS